ncbi:MAG: hypothetical protein LRY51_00640, partial [Geovibrio sp.]|nr:hypothetical protein [Geovibrio sp.]
FTVVSTAGTYDFLAGHGIEVERIKKVSEGRPNIVDAVKKQGDQLLPEQFPRADAQGWTRNLSAGQSSATVCLTLLPLKLLRLLLPPLNPKSTRA